MSDETHQAESEALRAGAEVELPADDTNTHAEEHLTYTIDDACAERRDDAGPLTTNPEAQEPESIVEPPHRILNPQNPSR